MKTNEIVEKILDCNASHSEAINNLAVQISEQNKIAIRQTEVIDSIKDVIKEIPVNIKSINEEYHNSIQATIAQANQSIGLSQQTVRLAEEKLQMSMDEKKKIEKNNKLLLRIIIVLGGILIGTLAGLKAIEIIKLI